MNPHHSNDASIKSTSVVKYLEILPSEPILEPTISPQIDLARLSVVQLDDITVQYYRQLYEATGSMWLWRDRRDVSDEALEKMITSPDCSIHVLRVDGADDAGYFELDWKRDQTNTVKNVEILYFGLIPKYIGQKIGPWFLNQCLKTIREREPQARIWVHTCNWDHEKALATYKKAGFKQYKEEVEPITVPPGYVHPSQLQTQVQS